MIKHISTCAKVDIDYNSMKKTFKGEFYETPVNFRMGAICSCCGATAASEDLLDTYKNHVSLKGILVTKNKIPTVQGFEDVTVDLGEGDVLHLQMRRAVL